MRSPSFVAYGDIFCKTSLRAPGNIESLVASLLSRAGLLVLLWSEAAWKGTGLLVSFSLFL